MNKLKRDDVPSGYIPGMSRSENGFNTVSHLYNGDFENPGLPMCRRGWNVDGGNRYSIFRNVISKSGICMICLKRASNGLKGVI